MELLEIFFGVVAAYFLGSIPTSILISKVHFGIDIRDHGSGEASHLNVYEILGWKVSWILRFLDIAKGYLALTLLCWLQSQWRLYDIETMEIMRMSFGLAIILGHTFPVWAKLKGGKGVHVAIGLMLVLAPQTIVFCIIIALLTWAFTSDQNFAYVLGSAALPAFMIFAGRDSTEYYFSMLVFSFLLFIFLFATHAKSLKIRRFRWG